jgi:hypothetical protein
MPFAVVSGDPAKPKPFSISDDQWVEIERAYGHAFDATIKLEILRVTTSFVLFEPFERAALRLAASENRAQSIRWSAEKFFSDLFGGPSDDATVFADELIDRYFNGRMPQLRELLSSLAVACNSALTEISPREGAAWDQWACGLTTILDAAGLPIAASKGRGKSKSDSPSAFVWLVLKLQDCVPKEARRHNTRDGLASAINRARTGFGSKPERPSTKK